MKFDSTLVALFAFTLGVTAAPTPLFEWLVGAAERAAPAIEEGGSTLLREGVQTGAEHLVSASSSSRSLSRAASGLDLEFHDAIAPATEAAISKPSSSSMFSSIFKNPFSKAPKEFGPITLEEQQALDAAAAVKTVRNGKIKAGLIGTGVGTVGGLIIANSNSGPNESVNVIEAAAPTSFDQQPAATGPGSNFQSI